ncbi:MAG: hypothetical protein FJ151_01110 [Euryarchaeota archaeon]|nr:hypothetical protein [Euryarchaeota archaeon]
MLTPNLIFVDSPEFPSPSYADLTLRTGETDGGAILCRGGGSEDFDLRIPSDLKIPLAAMTQDGSASSTSEGEVSLVRAQCDDISGIVKDLSAELIILGSAFELRRDARGFVESVVALREAARSDRLIYAPGMMETGNIALLCYLGIDLIDSSLLVYQAARGNLVLPEGIVPADQVDWLLEATSSETILDFNLVAAWKELGLVRHMLKIGRLRELVEMRVHANPWAVAALRLLDIEHYDYQEKRTAVVGPSFYCNARQSLLRPDVRRFRCRILERYRRPAHKKVLLLLPCSAKKPYSTSKTHRAFRSVLESVRNNQIIHEVILTSPLGAVPRELELFYPAAQYDIPVTGHWDRDEVSIVLEMVRRFIAMGYERTICHLGDERDFVCSEIDCIDTSGGRPSSADSLDRLRGALEESCSYFPDIHRAEDRIGTMESVAVFQFGEGAEKLVGGCHVAGNYPYLRILEGGGQVAMLTPERGMLSLTLRGAEKILPLGLNLVEMEDFKLEGNLFAVGVKEADRRIRIGDEAIVLRNGELEAVGVASMSGEEMFENCRGEAVRIRHRVKH